ncbi:MAG: glycosyltransferase [Eubacterium sp.]|nr:glycosyltransferase [Eubacterium sp.]
MRILFLTNLLPYPLDNGGKIKTFSTLKALSIMGNSVDLLCFSENSENDSGNVQKLKNICNDVQFIEHKLTTKSNIKYMMAVAFRSLFSKYPFGIYKYESKQMRDVIAKKIKENDYDIIYFDHLQMYKYFNSFDRKNVKFVLDQHNSESEIVYRTYQNSNNFLKKIFLTIEYNKIRKFEKKALSDVDKIYALSENDVESMKHLNVNLKNFSVIPIGVIDNGIINKKEDKNKKLTLMFIGTLTWNPNNQGILWFVRNVIPKLNESGIEYDLYIVGKNPSDELKELCESYNNIFVTGYVNDVDEMYVKSDVMVVPLFVGSGQRVKIIESFSKGIPVISTSIGAEGLDCITDYNVVIADTDIEFVDSLRKMSDETFRKKIASNARKTFEEKYSLEAYISAFNDSFKAMILKK